MLCSFVVFFSINPERLKEKFMIRLQVFYVSDWGKFANYVS